MGTRLTPLEVLDREIEKERKAIARRVAKGAKLLDRQRPGWANEVRITKLQMSDPHQCVLGEIYAERDPETGELSLYSVNGFDRGSEELGLSETDAQPEYGFDLDSDACDRVRRSYRNACIRAGVAPGYHTSVAIDSLWKVMGDLWKDEIRQRRAQKAAKA